MRTPARGLPWLARASAWTCAAFGLSVGAHVVGGGRPPAPGGSAFLVVALLWVGLLLTRRRLGALPLITTLGTSQLLLHAGLTLTERSVACSPGASPPGAHVGHGVGLTCDAPTSGVMAALTHGEHSTLTMALSHLLAAVALGVVLTKGEDAAWRIAGLLLPHLPMAPPLPSPTRRVLAPFGGGEYVSTVPVLGGVGRRGPPVRRAPGVA